MSKVISKGALGETCEAVFERGRREGFGTAVEGVLGETLGGASEGASRTAPQALQVALGN